jgi:hypothetical protein
MELLRPSCYYSQPSAEISVNKSEYISDFKITLPEEGCKNNWQGVVMGVTLGY